jgi:hypothetical protein
MRTAKEEGVFDEPEYYDELVENGVSENKQKPKTLYRYHIPLVDGYFL